MAVDIPTQRFAAEIIQHAQALAAVADVTADLEKEYFDAGYNNMTQEQLGALNVTPAEIASIITVLQQFGKLMTSQATTPADYMSSLNKVRRAGS